MPQPTRSQIHVDKFLTNTSIAFRQKAEDYIADRVFPNVPVQKQSDLYPVYRRADWNRVEFRKRGAGSEGPLSGFNVDRQNYFADVWSLGSLIPWEDLQNQDTPISLERDKTIWLTEQDLKNRDKQWASNNFKTGVWALDQTGVAAAPVANQFLQFDQAGSEPINVFRSAMRDVKKRTGLMPNVLVLGSELAQVLEDHPDFLDRIKFSERGIIGMELLAAVLQLDRVLVAEAVENTAAEGAAEASAFIVDSKAALLAYSAPRPGILTPSAGYTFVWKFMAPGASAGTGIFRDVDRRKRSNIIEMDAAWDQNIVSVDLARFFDQAIA